MIRVPDKARAHILANPKQAAKAAAIALGVAPQTVRNWRSALIQEGALSYRAVTERAAEVRDLLRDGLRRRDVARRLGVSPTAVTEAVRFRLGSVISEIRRNHAYSGAELIALLGYSPTSGYAWRLLERWGAMGLYTGRASKRSHYRITAHDLMAFLERPDCPVDPARIADPDWRQYAEAARAGHLKPVEVVDWRRERPTPLCECGAVVTKKGRRCKSCAMRGNSNRKGRQHAAAD